MAEDARSAGSDVDGEELIWRGARHMADGQAAKGTRLISDGIKRLTNEIGQLREAYRERTDQLIAAQAEVDVLRGRDEGNEMVLT